VLENEGFGVFGIVHLAGELGLAGGFEERGVELSLGNAESNQIFARD
jgi:hypothetical protein